MTGTETLTDLRARLTGGLAAAISRRRPQQWEADDERHLEHPALARALRTLYGVTDGGGLSPAAVETEIAELATAFQTARPALIAVLFSPGSLLERAPAMAERRTATPIEHWMGLCWVAEAAWRAVDQGLPGEQYATGDDALLRPVAARLRFLSLSEPMRARAHVSEWLPENDLYFYDHRHGLLDRVFGSGTWNGLVGRCADARRIWREHLDTYQDHFLLAGASPADLEDDFHRLVFRTEPGGGPLVLSTEPLSEPVAPTAEDTLLITGVTDRHLLPRFDLRSVYRLAWHDTTPQRARARAISGALVVVLAAAAVVALFWSVRLAAVAAFLAYAQIIFGTIFFDQRWTAPWLLRLPATAAVGLLVLITLPHDWWTKRPTDANPAHWIDPAQVPWHIPLLLLFAAYGYLIIEGRNHGLSPGMSLCRGLAVTGLGLIHGTLVATIGVITLLPAFGEAGTSFAAHLWTGSARHIHQAWVLAFAATWCLAVGVFSQILWDDRPITAPLAHLSWRSER